MTTTPPSAMFATPPFEPLPEAPAPAHFADELLLRLRRRIDERSEDEAPVDPLAPADAQAIAEWIGGGAAPGEEALRAVAPLKAWTIDGLTLVQRLRLIAAGPDRSSSYWRYDRDLGWHGLLPADYRQLHEALIRTGIGEGTRRELELMSLLVHGRATRWREGFRAPMTAWEHHAEDPWMLAAILGVDCPVDTEQQDLVTAALGTLAVIQEHGPVPEAFAARAAELATGPSKSVRPAAQAALVGHPGGAALMAGHLGERRADAREEAATWIGRHGSVEEAPALEARLRVERDPSVRAALLGALIRLGVPAERLLAPDALRREAEEGLAHDASAIPEWMPFERLPELRWADGSPVPAQVPTWWIAYADRIGDPTGKGLIPRYLDALDVDSADRLGRFALDAWIAHDAQHPSEEEVRADPEGFFAAVLNKTNPDGTTRSWSAQERLEYALRHRDLLYPASAIAQRGVLALAARTDGAWFADRVTRFLREHRGRRAQAEALLRAAAAHPAPEALQVLLGAARRHRQKTVQALAVELVEHLARRRGWTALQLADRTVPAAGLDDRGRLRLDFGARRFTAQLADDLVLSLHDDDPSAPDGLGPARKTLPEPAAADDPQLAAAAKKELSAARGELKRVVAAQKARLVDAMIVQQRWPAPDWRELSAHPVLRRLVRGFVWAVHRDGEAPRLGRPAADGALLDAQGLPVDLDDADELTIAHGAVLPAAAAAPWRAARGLLHPQFSVPAVDLDDPARDGADSLDDRSGWIIDALVLRGAATKQGFERGRAEDGSIVHCYAKGFEAAGVMAVLEFSGLPVQQREGAVSLLDLRFQRALARDGLGGLPLALADVPPVLLAEAHAAYLAIAKKASIQESGPTGMPDAG